MLRWYIHKIKLYRNDLQRDYVSISRPDIYFVDTTFPVTDYFNIDWVNNNFIGKPASYKEDKLTISDNLFLEHNEIFKKIGWIIKKSTIHLSLNSISLTT